MKNTCCFSYFLKLQIVLIFIAFLASCSTNPGRAIVSQTAGKYAIYGMMSANAYHHEETQFPLDLMGWQLIDLDDKATDDPAFDDKKTGLAFDIWKHSSDDQVVFAFRGTDSPLDFPQSNLWIIPPPPAFRQAQQEIRAYQTKHPTTKLIATGHSLGGGLSLGISSRNESIDAITFDTSPNDHDPNSKLKNNAMRVLVYQKGEVLAKVRSQLELMGKASTIPEENTYYTNFDFGKGPISRHDSYPLALGLLKLGTESNPQLKPINDAVIAEQQLFESAANVNWMDQTALVALYATHIKQKDGSTVNEHFSDSSCLRGDDPNTPPVNWKDRVKKIENKSIARASGLDEQQRKEAWQLLVSGRAANDIKGSIKSTFENMYKINPELLKDTVTKIVNPRSTVSLIGNLKKDVNFSNLKNKPSVLSNTLKAIKSEPLGEVVSEAVKVFIDSNNRTMRLAIIAYARMNGINITEENLDDLNQLFADDPDLYPLLAGMLDTMKAEYGISEAADGMQRARDKIAEIKGFEASCN